MYAHRNFGFLPRKLIVLLHLSLCTERLESPFENCEQFSIRWIRLLSNFLFVVYHLLRWITIPWYSSCLSKSAGEIHPPSWPKERMFVSCCLGLFYTHSCESPKDFAKLPETTTFPSEFWKNTVMSNNAQFGFLAWVVWPESNKLLINPTQEHAGPDGFRMFECIDIELFPFPDLGCPVLWVDCEKRGIASLEHVSKDTGTLIFKGCEGWSHFLLDNDAGEPPPLGGRLHPLVRIDRFFTRSHKAHKVDSIFRSVIFPSCLRVFVWDGFRFFLVRTWTFPISRSYLRN